MNKCRGMNARDLAWAVACLCLTNVTSELSAAETRIGHHLFTHPEGFELQLVAGPPLIDRPIEMAFDFQGRLYCTDSAGVNDGVEQQLQEKPHQILRLEDTDGDGVFDQRTVFADQMMFPEGCLWYDGSLYVAAPPSIWKLTDTDNDGVADQREEWFQGKTLTGCANDLHGPYLGLDGRIYWTKGAFAEQDYLRPDGSQWVTRAAHVFRARPDGGSIEAVMTGGMDNPVGVTFTPGGERIFTTTFFQHPGGGNRDGLVHAIYGGVYGKEHGVIEGHIRTGDLMPVLTHLGAAAPAGLTRYRSGAFGSDYQDNLFSALFNMQRIVRHQLKPKGASFESHDEVFLQSNNRDFHPTDVEEDADGSLLVVDTGGWYKLCCPTSQLPKPEVLGGIYRIRRSSAAEIESPRGKELKIAAMDAYELLRRLDDPRPAVGDQIVHRLYKEGAASLNAVASIDHAHLSGLGAQRLVWMLTRIDGSAARELVLPFLNHRDALVRSAALHSVSLHRDKSALSDLLRILETDVISNRRVAAEALGRLGRVEAIPVLLKQIGVGHGRVLEHSLIFALIEIGDVKSIANGLNSENEWIRRGTLIALDQLGASNVSATDLLSALGGDHEETRRTAREIAGRRTSLGSAFVPQLKDWLRDIPASGVPESELVELLIGLGGQESIATLIGAGLIDTKSPLQTRFILLETIRRSDASLALKSWGTVLVSLLQNRESDLLPQVVRAAAPLAAADGVGRSLLKELMRLSVDDTIGREEQLISIGAVAPHLDSLQNAQYQAIVSSVTINQSVTTRSLAAAALQKASLSQQQLFQFANVLSEVGPLELAACLRVFEKASHRRIGDALVGSLGKSPGRSGLDPIQLKQTFESFPDSVRQAANKLLEQVSAGFSEKQDRLKQMLAALPKGDVRRGQAVFNSSKAACVSCHEIGYLGGDVGPDLTRIGRVRTKEDLLEAIVYPSMSFVRSYEPYHLMTNDGDQYSGIIRNDDGQRIQLVVGPVQTISIEKESVFELGRSQTSLMPGGMAEILSETELSDLLAFLAAAK